MTTAKPTPGPWIVSGLLSDNVTVHTMGIPSNIDPACKLQIADCFDRESQLSWEEMNSNANLIAEAGTVYHETSLTPRQLDDQRRELFGALEKMLLAFQGNEQYDEDDALTIAIARNALAKAKGQSC